MHEEEVNMERVQWFRPSYFPRLPYLLLILCILLYAWWWHTSSVLFYIVHPCARVPSVLSFEDPSELDYFKYPPTSHLSTTSKHYKDGYHSLVWTWEPGDKLSLPLGRSLTGNNSGIKIWIYRNETVQANLTITLSDTITSSTVLSFNFSLNFEGWRVAWVRMAEAKTTAINHAYNSVEIQAPLMDIPVKMVFVDLLCFSQNIRLQSRDDIVPPLRNLYTIADYWQQVYKWSRVTPPPVDKHTPLTENEQALLDNVTLVHKRLLNWYANESLGPSHYRGDLKKRWESLIVYGFQQARKNIKLLNITVANDSTLTGSPLFARNSEFGNSKKVGGNKKLGWVVTQVLLPLTLEYYFSTKPQSIEEEIARELKHINSGPGEREKSVGRITKKDTELTKAMLEELDTYKTMVSKDMLRDVLEVLNRKKLDVILQLLEYITDQGWADGSAFGSLDHQTNVAGSGFIHSLFLLKPVLMEKGRPLETLTRTMRWYTWMGEIYQTKFEYNGTSADIMRTIMLFRLETILMNPGQSIKEQREILRDMEAYRRWCNNIFLPATALLTTFKKDLSCFHHKGVYGTAYTYHALTIAATVYYLLDGTTYSLSSISRENIRARLDLYRKMAVLYSLPKSISGRFPNYSKATLIRMLPGYAVFSTAPQYLNADGKLQGVRLSSDREMIEIFLRLYQPHDLKVQAYLRGGSPDTRLGYMQTLGNLEIMEAVFTQAKKAGLTPAKSSTGHWVMNYGPLSIHRRRNWVVSVKGFSRYFWDFESSATENVYGLYESHGALQISNSEESLAVYDVEHGWDWSRVPGTTTINMGLELMKSKSITSRFYQPSKVAGGVLLVSKDPQKANGLFAMRFKQPRYVPHSYESRLGFSFKKSVFFYNSLVVCLGSDITVTKSSPNRTQTTLFQDTLVEPSSSSAIYVNGDTHWLKQDLRLRINDSAAILDTNGNGYFVPNDSSLNIEISLQKSRTDNGLESSNGRYATTWLDHGVNPLSAHYEYAILVATDAAGVEGLRSAQASLSPRYIVLQKSSEVHIVVFRDKESETYGYTFFDPQVVTEGPVERVSEECVLMAQVDDMNFSNINLSVSPASVNFNTTSERIMEGNVHEMFYMSGVPVHVTVHLKRSVLVDIQRVLVDGNSVVKSQFDNYVQVLTKTNGDDPEPRGSQVLFKIVNGESVEAYLISDL